MSRIGSSSGVRVAAAPLSNVYTVLLLVGALALILVLTALWMTTNQKYGVILGVSEEGSQNMKAPEREKVALATQKKNLDDWTTAHKEFKAVPTADEAKAAAEASKAGATTAPTAETPTATTATGTDATPPAPAVTETPAPAPAVTGSATPTGSAL